MLYVYMDVLTLFFLTKNMVHIVYLILGCTNCFHNNCMKAETGDITHEFAGVINVTSKELFWSHQITLKMIASQLNVLLVSLNHKRRGLRSIL